MILGSEHLALKDLFNGDNLWILVMGYLVGATCGLLGNYLVLRRMAFLGDAISHSVLPGIVVSFLIIGKNSSLSLLLGAFMAAAVTVCIVHLIQLQRRIKSDTAIGIAFSTLFAVGVILIAVFADKVDLDQDCVLYGEIGFITCHPMLRFLNLVDVPSPVVQIASVLIASIVFIILYYKELLISSFDEVLASVMGINTTRIYYLLMLFVTLAVVASFESVGAILVVGMLVFPSTTASLLSKKLRHIMIISLVLPLLYSVLGLYGAIVLDTSISGAMITVAMGLFLLVWILRCMYNRLSQASTT